MSVEQARGLVQKVADDADFRASLEAAGAGERRAILDEHGFGDVKISHVSEAVPESQGGELSDEEFAAVAGGGNTTTIVVTAASSAADVA